MSVTGTDGVRVRWKPVLFSTPPGTEPSGDGERSPVGQCKDLFAQGLGSTTSGNVFSASLTASSGKKAATHTSIALTQPLSGMLLFFPTKEWKRLQTNKWPGFYESKKHFSTIKAKEFFTEFLRICDDFWSNISFQDLTEVWAYRLIILALLGKRSLVANVSNLQNTSLSSTMWDVGVSSSITSALPCSTTNRVPPWNKSQNREQQCLWLLMLKTTNLFWWNCGIKGLHQTKILLQFRMLAVCLSQAR